MKVANPKDPRKRYTFVAGRLRPFRERRPCHAGHVGHPRREYNPVSQCLLLVCPTCGEVLVSTYAPPIPA